MDNFLDNIDKNKIESLIKETENNVEYFQQIVRNVVKDYSKDLDILMESIYKDIVNNNQPPLNTLEKYYLELSNLLYFIGDGLEKLGVYEAMSKSAYKEVYNNAYLNIGEITDSKKKPTVAELSAKAENIAQYELVINDLYSKAYRIVKNKIDSASTMLSCLSKIISKRMTEMQLNSFTPSGKAILNEDFASNYNSSGNSLIDQFNYNKVIC